MIRALDTRSIIAHNFYDTGHGEAGLTDRYQCSVTVTKTNPHGWAD